MAAAFRPIISKAILKRNFDRGFIVPLAVKIACPHDPWKLFVHLKRGHHSFFLDSVKAQAATARYSFFGFEPFMIVQLSGRSMLVEMGLEKRRISGDFLNNLRKLFSGFKSRTWPALPFLTGGAVGYFGYDVAWNFEKLPRIARRDTKIPDGALFFMKQLFVFDHEKNELYLISNLMPKRNRKFEDAYCEALDWIIRSERAIQALVQADPAFVGKISIKNFKPDVSKKRFKQMVSRAKRFIESGDIYQANLSQRFSFNFKGSAELLYDQLRLINPSPFSSFMQMEDLLIVSASPERLVKKVGSHCETRPIAGTRPRGKTAEQNRKLRQELLASAKEQAEHIMLVDLERNDLGRVCKPHSVRVTEHMALEEYSHVIHLVSNVEGVLEKDKDLFDLLKAMFPGGTITGCPKIRCMEIIELLEPYGRGLYTGSIGYLGFNGDLDLNIVIRTIVLKKNKGYFQVGAGIVHDSNPESEYWETIYKGKALVEALNKFSRS